MQKAFVRDIPAYHKWIEENAGKDHNWYEDNWRGFFYERRDKFGKRDILNIFISSGWYDREKLWAILDEMETLGEWFAVEFREGIATVLRYNGCKWLFPAEWLTFKDLEDYSDTPMSSLASMGGVPAALPDAGMNLPENMSTMSLSTAAQCGDALKQENAALAERKKLIQNGECQELKALTDQIRQLEASLKKQQDALLARLQEQEEELARKKELLEAQITVLETQIYSIRCYRGETATFHTFLSGRPAPVNEPIVLYQKVRYLDEEIGKYVSLYHNTANMPESFIRLLSAREDIRNLFVPSEKCISVVRMSRTGKCVGASDVVANLLEQYDLLHGKQMAVLVRSGENISIAWLDEDRISLAEEEVYFQPKDAVAVQAEDEAAVHESTRGDKVSRYFLFSLFQGIIDSGKLLALPERVSFMSPSPYIVYSLAEGWLADTTYGTLADILNKSAHITLRQGDEILVGSRVTRDDSYSERTKSYSNDRGIGSTNRTHDARIKPGIHPINKILYDYVIEVEYKKEYWRVETGTLTHEYILSHGDGSKTQETEEYTGDKLVPVGAMSEETFTECFTVPADCQKWKADTLASCCRAEDNKALIGLAQEHLYTDTSFYVCDGERFHRTSLSDKFQTTWEGGLRAREEEKNLPHFRKRLISAKIAERIPHYYLSVQGTSYLGNPFPVNFEVMNEEFLPLPYLCASWMEYVITNQQLGAFRQMGTNLSYAEALPYLNQALAYLRTRAEEEHRLLEQAGLREWLNATPDWDVQVTEWRIDKQVRRLTPHAAERFAAAQNFHIGK